MSLSFSKPYDASRDNTLAFVRFLMLLVVLMGAGMFYMLHVVDKAQQEIQVSIPPDLTHGVTMRAGDKDETELYAFALTQLQSLHHWTEDGSVEYPLRIKEHEDLITPSYRAFLQRDYDRRKKQGELHARSRVLMPLAGSFFSPDKVKRLGSDDWEVALELQLIETYLGGTIKKIRFRYPAHIVRNSVESNKTNTTSQYRCWLPDRSFQKPRYSGCPTTRTYSTSCCLRSRVDTQRRGCSVRSSPGRINTRQ